MDLHQAALDRIASTLAQRREGWVDDRVLHAEARALSVAYTEQRTSTPAKRVDAYYAYFAPRTVAATARLAPLLPLEGAEILELGSGTGAASLVCALAGAKRLTLIEPLEDARRAAAGLLSGFEVRQRDRLSREAHATLILLAFSYGEIFAETSPAEALARLEQLAPKAKDIAILEPGDRNSARALQALRDVALEAGWRPVAPCPHHGPCPALERPKDWCHTFVDRRLSEGFASFAAAVGRDVDRMALSYLILTKREVAPVMGVARVLADGRAEKGRARAWVCAPDEVRYVQALKRHGAAHKRVKGLSRGELVRLEGTSARGDTAHLDDVEAELRTGIESAVSVEADLEKLWRASRFQLYSPRNIWSWLELTRKFQLKFVRVGSVKVEVPAGLLPDCVECEECCCAGPNAVVSLRLRDIARLVDAGLEHHIAPATGKSAPRGESWAALEASWSVFTQAFPVLERDVTGTCTLLTDDLMCGAHPAWPLSCERYPYAYDALRNRVFLAKGCRSHRTITLDDPPDSIKKLADAAVRGYNERLRDVILLHVATEELHALGLLRYLRLSGRLKRRADQLSAM